MASEFYEKKDELGDDFRWFDDNGQPNLPIGIADIVDIRNFEQKIKSKPWKEQELNYYIINPVFSLAPKNKRACLYGQASKYPTVSNAWFGGLRKKKTKLCVFSF